MVTTLIAEGWCSDPYGLHEARWLSAGTPTTLVRDRGVESHDPVPAGAPPRTAEPLDWGQKDQAGADLLRSDQAIRTRAQDFSHLCSTMLRGGSD
jgi:hypothetical protein